MRNKLSGVLIFLFLSIFVWNMGYASTIFTYNKKSEKNIEYLYCVEPDKDKKPQCEPVNEFPGHGSFCERKSFELPEDFSLNTFMMEFWDMDFDSFDMKSFLAGLFFGSQFGRGNNFWKKDFKHFKHGFWKWKHCKPDAPVPITGGIWLLGSGIVGLISLKKRFRSPK